MTGGGADGGQLSSDERLPDDSITGVQSFLPPCTLLPPTRGGQSSPPPSPVCAVGYLLEQS